MTKANPESSPQNLLRLSFSTLEDFVAYGKANLQMLTEIWLWHETLGDRAEPIQLPGICDICERQTIFTATPHKAPEGDRFAFRTEWWVSTCSCKKSTRDRAVMRILMDGGATGDRIYHVGHHSAFQHWLSERMPNVTTSEYKEGRQPGAVDNGIRYEDLTNLSFADGEFDCTICMDILEHIPDYRPALREMARILKPGGRALLTFPWLGSDYYDHLIRAEMLPDGTIHHILPPEYHGDPVNAEGILSFRAFGWKILDELRDAGFSNARAAFTFGPLHGHMTLLAPVIVGSR